jgi:hypothetical protein
LFHLTDSLSFEGRIVLSVFLLRIRFLFHWTENYKNFLSGISGPSHTVFAKLIEDAIDRCLINFYGDSLFYCVLTHRFTGFGKQSQDRLFRGSVFALHSIAT